MIYKIIKKDKKLAIAVIIFFIITGVYVSNGRYMTSGDCVSSKYLPVSIINEFNLNFNEFPFLYNGNAPHYSISNIGENYYSNYPLGSGLMVVPVYGLAKMIGIKYSKINVAILDKISATILVALSVTVLFLVLIEITNPIIAILLTFAYSFGTTSWSISCQSLWSHSSSQLLNVVGLWILMRGQRNDSIIPYAGIIMAISVLCRQTNGIVLGIMLIYILNKHKKVFIKTLILSSIPLFIYIYYNLSIFGHIFGGYRSFYLLETWKHFNLLLLLFSPSRGLLIYSPYLAIAFWGIIHVWKNRKDKLLLHISMIPIVYLIVYSLVTMWYAGACYGPRFFSDILPHLTVLMVPIMNIYYKKTYFRGIFLLLIMCSIGIHYIGATRYNYSWFNTIGDEIYNGTFNYWSIKHSQLLYFLKDGRIPTSEKKKKEYYVVKNGIIDFKEKESKKYISYGFSWTEEWGRWGIGRESKLYFHVPDVNKETRSVIINAASYRLKSKPQTVRIYFNDKLVKEHEFTKNDWEWEKIKFKLPAEIFNNSVEELKFIYGHARQADFFDIRRVSIEFKDIRIF